MHLAVHQLLPITQTTLYRFPAMLGSVEMKAILSVGGACPAGSVLFSGCAPARYSKSVKHSMDLILKQRFYDKINSSEDSVLEAVAKQEGARTQQQVRGPDKLRSIACKMVFEEELAPPMSRDLLDKLQLDEEENPDVFQAIK